MDARLVPIASLHDPALEMYTSLRENTHHWSRGCFVAESEKVVRRLLASDVGIVSFLLTPEWWDTLKADILGRPGGEVDVFLGPPELLETITGFTMHKSVMAIGRIPETQPAVPDGGLVVALEGIADAENMGMISRSCAGLGVSALVVGEDSTNPWLRRSVRVSMGTIFDLPIIRVPRLVAWLRERRESGGWRIIGTTPRGGSRLVPSVGGGVTCVLFGSEGHGLTAEALDTCTEQWSIPMHRGVDSLNVAHTVAIAAWALGATLIER